MTIRSTAQDIPSFPATSSTLPILAASGPPVLLALLIIGLTTVALFGLRPLWPPADLTLAEAAYLGDHATLVQGSRQGLDLNQRRAIRPGLRGNPAMELTPLEASVASGEIATLRLIAQLGVDLRSAAGRNAACFARQSEARSLLAFMEAQGVKLTTGSCAGIRKPW